LNENEDEIDQSEEEWSDEDGLDDDVSI